jgi:chitin-binding protein
MAVRRRIAAGAATVGVTAMGLWPVVPVQAHGAPVKPLSRTAACADPDADTANAAACRAARAANDGAFGTFDNLRVPDINGRDRQRIPDGKLCSAGLADYKGLDLPRDDWPATEIAAGGTVAVRYRTTIPHPGSFRIYLTRSSYDPTKKLTWDDLGSEPLLTAKEPPLRGGAYRMSLTLPENRTGRHLLYTVWQTTDSTDTYYSCSDVVLTASAGSVGAGRTSAEPRPSATRRSKQPSRSPAAAPADTGADDSGEDAVETPEPSVEPTADRGAELERTSSVNALPAADEKISLSQQLVTVVLVALAAAVAGLVFFRRRAARAQRLHRRPENR